MNIDECQYFLRLLLDLLKISDETGKHPFMRNLFNELSISKVSFMKPFCHRAYTIVSFHK